MRLGKAQKPLELLKLVQADMNQKRPVMIFSNRTATCDFVSMFLNENNIDCVNINGQMLVTLKMGKFDQYKNGKVNVLSCTDIASRGLDTTRVSFVFYSFINEIFLYLLYMVKSVRHYLNTNLTNIIIIAIL